VIIAENYIFAEIEIEDNNDPDAVSKDLLSNARCLLRKPCPLQCPGCTEKNPIVKYLHSKYRRWVSYYKDGKITTVHLLVPRVICSCGRTHSVLPNNVVPYAAETVKASLLIVLAAKVGLEEAIARMQAYDSSKEVNSTNKAIEDKVSAECCDDSDKNSNSTINKDDDYANNGDVHIDNSVAPVAEGDAPVAEGDAPVAEGNAPVAEGNAPVAEGNAPVADSVAPVAEGVAPVAEGVASACFDYVSVTEDDASATATIAAEPRKNVYKEDVKSASSAYRKRIIVKYFEEHKGAYALLLRKKFGMHDIGDLSCPEHLSKAVLVICKNLGKFFRMVCEDGHRMFMSANYEAQIKQGTLLYSLVSL
jgi:hypothetical protein